MDAHSSLLRQLRIAAMAAEIIFFEDTETATAVGKKGHTELRSLSMRLLDILL